MATTIISKVGSGEPSAGQLQQGEIGIDITNKVIWTYSEKDNEMVELAGGDISWEQIDKETLPDEIINILEPDGNPNYIDLDSLKAQVGKNSSDISDLWIAISEINTRIGGVELDLNALEGRVTTNEGGITTNAQEIVRLEGLINNGLTGLVLGGEYDANANVVVGLTNEGIDAGLRLDSPLPPPSESTKGIYVIVTVEGPLSGTGTKAPNREEDGTIAHVGDWLVSDGIHGWLLFELGKQDVTFGMIGGSPYDNTNLKAALDAKIDVDGTIDCGLYS
jgi:hypothetical protein